MAEIERPSNNSVRKAGSTLRKYSHGKVTEEQRDSALAIIATYRSCFAPSLLRVNSRLKAISSGQGLDAKITQRLKREATIIDKLTHRETGLSLDRMIDIGGCRAVVPTLDDVRQLEGLVKGAWADSVDNARFRDYITSPRQSGYRAVHIIVRQDGLPIEIQLRSQFMHSWAQFMEKLSGHLGENFKQDGTSPVQDLGRTLSLFYSASEEGRSIDNELSSTLDRQLAAVEKLLERPTK